MLDIVFSENAAGGLKLAQHYGQGRYLGGSVGVILSSADGSPPSQAELARAQREAEERARRAWEEAVPLGGNPGDVFGFGLGLDMGPLADAPFGPLRAAFLQQLLAFGAEVGEPAPSLPLPKAQTALKRLLARARAGEGMRLWVGSGPADGCGFCWLMHELQPLEGCLGALQVVRLPPWRQQGETAVHYLDWGELSPGEWGHFLPLAEALPGPIRQAAARRWRELQAENAPLRALVNGRLLSVGADFYDPFLERELAAAPAEFHEAQLIGQVLGRYPLGIGDCLLASRIEAMIAAGRLQPLGEPAPGNPRYRRRLRKTGR